MSTQVQQYVQQLFRCVIDGVALSSNTCTKMSYALEEYLFEAHPERNCLYQNGMLCQFRQAIQFFTINVFVPDPTFQQK